MIRASRTITFRSQICPSCWLDLVQAKIGPRYCRTCENMGWISAMNGKAHPPGTCTDPEVDFGEFGRLTCCDSLDGCPDCDRSLQEMGVA